MNESPLVLTFHGVTLVSSLAILGLMLRQHKVWVRIKDRLDSLWEDYCVAHGIRFKKLDENGH